jgi:hypothetical protein
MEPRDYLELAHELVDARQRIVASVPSGPGIAAGAKVSALVAPWSPARTRSATWICCATARRRRCLTSCQLPRRWVQRAAVEPEMRRPACAPEILERRRQANLGQPVLSHTVFVCRYSAICSLPDSRP